MPYKYFGWTGRKKRLITPYRSGEHNFLLWYWKNSYRPQPQPTPPMSQAIYAEIIDLITPYVGRPYVWGGKSPPDFDCSGLISWAYHAVGLLPSAGLNVRMIWADCRETAGAVFIENIEEAQAGDIIFYSADGQITPTTTTGHVGMYVGDGMILDSNYKRGVGYVPYTYHTKVKLVGFWRLPT